MKLFRETRKQIGNLCPPAQVYLVISIVAFLSILFQNNSDPTMYCIGKYNISCPNNAIFFLMKAIYIAIWVFILQKLCSGGYTTASWILVLLPIIAMFIFIGLAMIYFTKMTIDI